MARCTQTASCGASGGHRPILQHLRSRKGLTHETPWCPGLPDACSLCSQGRRMQEAHYRCAVLASLFLLSFDHLGRQGLESRWSESCITLSAKDIKVGKQDTAGYSCFLLNMSHACGYPPQLIPLTLFSSHPIKHSFNSEGEKKKSQLKQKKKKHNNEFLTYCPKEKAGPGADP